MKRLSPARIALTALAIIATTNRPAMATVLPAVDLTHREAVVTLGSSGFTYGAAADMSVVEGLSFGAVFHRVGPPFQGTHPEFGAVRLTHRLWAFRGGTSLGYVLSCGLDRHDGLRAPLDAAMFQPALAAALPFTFGDGLRIVLRTTYGPVVRLHERWTGLMALPIGDGPLPPV